MNTTTEAPLANVKSGDMLSRIKLNSRRNEWEFCYLERVRKRTPKRLYFSNHEWCDEHGRSRLGGTYRIPTADDLAAHEEKKRQQAAFNAAQEEGRRVRSLPQVQSLTSIIYAIKEAESYSDRLLRIADAIGLERLKEIEAIVHDASR